MKFTFASTAAAVTFCSSLVSAYNGFINPTEGEVIPAGKPYLIKWEADTPGPVNITLRKGPRKNLDTLYSIVMLEYNWGNYTWDVPADTPAAKDYAFEMKWGKNPGPDDVNYTGLFEISSDVKDGDHKSTTATATGSPTKSATESSYPTTTKTGHSSSPTETETQTETSSPTGTKNSTSTKTSSPSVTPSPKNENSSAGVVRASMGVAAAVALAAAALL